MYRRTITMTAMLFLAGGCNSSRSPSLGAPPGQAHQPVTSAPSPINTALPNRAKVFGGLLEDAPVVVNKVDFNPDVGITGDPNTRGEADIEDIHTQNRYHVNYDVIYHPCPNEWRGAGLQLYRVTGSAGEVCPSERYVVSPDDAGCNSQPVSVLDAIGDLLIAIPGELDKNGNYTANKDRYTLSCLTGVAAKCAYWGYPPWRSSQSGVPLADLYQTCIKAVTARYKSEDLTKSYTCDNTLTDIYDKYGIQRINEDNANQQQGVSMEFESSWTLNRLSCLRRERYPGCGLQVDPGCAEPEPNAWGDQSVLLAVRSYKKDPYATCVADNPESVCRSP